MHVETEHSRCVHRAAYHARLDAMSQTRPRDKATNLEKQDAINLEPASAATQARRCSGADFTEQNYISEKRRILQHLG